jgi:hypothetical protein
MLEQTISRTIALSDRHPDIKVSMTLRVDFQPPEYSVEVSRSPSLISLEFIEPMWSQGIHSGVLHAVHEVNNILLITGIQINIQSLEVSEHLEIFEEEEIQKLGGALNIMAYDTLYPIFLAKVL